MRFAKEKKQKVDIQVNCNILFRFIFIKYCKFYASLYYELTYIKTNFNKKKRRKENETTFFLYLNHIQKIIKLLI